MMRRNRTGFSCYFLLFYLVIATLFCSLAGEWGRVHLAQLELQQASDTAARAAAAAIPDGIASARAEAKFWAGKNKVAGQALLLEDSDITFLKFNSATGTYLPENFAPDTVRIQSRRSADRGTAIPLLWTGLFNLAGRRNSLDVHAKTAVRYYPGFSFNQTIRATANPFLAGMAPGSVASLNNPHNSPDYTGKNGKVESGPLGTNTVAGQKYTFDNISGDARHDPNLADYQPDGQLDDIGTNTASDRITHRENGIRDGSIPINALVGIFLTDLAPNDRRVDFTTPAFVIDPAKCPADYNTYESRNRLNYQPALQQVFFIGDGRTEDGRHQTFVAPAGAKRLFLATWDFYEWNNNSGDRTVKINPTPGSMVTVE